MRNAIVLALVLAAAPPTWQAAQACGDKFLLVGRGARFQKVYAAIRPGNILIYARPGTTSMTAIRDPQFQKNLRQAGHAVSAIEDSGLLERALQSSSFDIVLADVADAPRIDALIAAAPSHPKPLYVMYPKAAEQVEIKAQYACKLKSTDRATRFLDLIDDEMKARAPRRSSKS